MGVRVREGGCRFRRLFNFPAARRHSVAGARRGACLAHELDELTACLAVAGCSNASTDDAGSGDGTPATTEADGGAGERDTFEEISGVPGVTDETISYGIPTFRHDGGLMYFAAFKRHVGLYPPVRDATLAQAAARYANDKGNLAFPLDEPMPWALIERIARSQLAAKR